jgi:hypothetical protein
MTKKKDRKFKDDRDFETGEQMRARIEARTERTMKTFAYQGMGKSNEVSIHTKRSNHL